MCAKDTSEGEDWLLTGPRRNNCVTKRRELPHLKQLLSLDPQLEVEQKTMFLWASKPAFFLILNHISIFLNFIKVKVKSCHGVAGALQSKTPLQFLNRESGGQPETTTVWLLIQGPQPNQRHSLVSFFLKTSVFYLTEQAATLSSFLSSKQRGPQLERTEHLLSGWLTLLCKNTQH